MLSSKDKALLEFTLQMLDEAEEVIRRHGSAYSALNDMEGRNAILLIYFK